jgi:hypothetical protein
MLAATSFYEDPLTIFVTGMILVILFFWYFATDIERRKRNVGTVLLIGMTALCVLAATPVKERLKGGIDIVGGSSFTLRVQPRESDSGEKMEVTSQQVEQAILVIEKRLNSMGTSEPLIARQGTDGILVQMPLPRHLDTDEVIRRIDPAKDVDGLHPVNLGKLAMDDLTGGSFTITNGGVFGSLLSTPICPPSAVTTRLQIARPSPVPGRDGPLRCGVRRSWAGARPPLAAGRLVHASLPDQPGLRATEVDSTRRGLSA